MKIHEYQAKAILARYGVPVQPGRVASIPEEAEAIARELGRPVVIKAQVYVGGRGKAGGIQFGNTPEEARGAAAKVLGMNIKGLNVEKVLVTPQVDIQEEYYLGIVLDRTSQAPVVMVSKEGGIDIEEVAATAPEKIIKDNALFRQKEYATWAEPEESNPLEYEARQEGLTYVKLNGDVGIIGNGAGLVMTTLDMVARVGGKPANFLDIGGGAKAEVMHKALTFVARDPGVQGILVNIFGGITRGEEVARGVILAQSELPQGMPIVVRLSGTGAEEGRAMLKDAGLEWGQDMRDAAEKIVAAISSKREGEGETKR
jgi:succinyl-CoA synthetase beta subunit